MNKIERKVAKLEKAVAQLMKIQNKQMILLDSISKLIKIQQEVLFGDLDNKTNNKKATYIR